MREQEQTMVRGMVKSVQHAVERNPRRFLGNMTAWMESPSGQDALVSIMSTMVTCTFMGKLANGDQPIGEEEYFRQALPLYQQGKTCTFEETTLHQQQLRSFLERAITDGRVVKDGDQLILSESGLFWYQFHQKMRKDQSDSDSDQ